MKYFFSVILMNSIFPMIFLSKSDGFFLDG